MMIDDNEIMVQLFNFVYKDSINLNYFYHYDQLESMDFCNLSMIFPWLSFDDQLYYFDQFCQILLIENGTFLLEEQSSVSHLISSIEYYSGNYTPDTLRYSIAPICIQLLKRIVSETGNSKSKPIKHKSAQNAKITVEMIKKIIALWMKCIDYIKPLNWQQLSIDEPEMAPILELLQNCVQAFYQPDCLNDLSNRIFFHIYVAMRKEKLLLKKHLIPILNKQKRINIFIKNFTQNTKRKFGKQLTKQLNI